MIGALHGKFVARQGADLLIDVHGVGYQVTATSNVLSRCGERGDDLHLVIFTDVKENSISLFGFDSLSEREVFLLLRKVKGIGSKLALSIVSFLGAEELLLSIGQSDVSAIKRVPGVGKKTAERVIVELREQVGASARDIAEAYVPVRGKTAEQIGSHSYTQSFITDAELALVKLGFSAERSRNAVNAALEKKTKLLEMADAGELLKEALAHI
jgi:holliday junction DNA helicase RuvA